MLYYKKKIEYSILDALGNLANQRTVGTSQGVGAGEARPSSLLPTLSAFPSLSTYRHQSYLPNRKLLGLRMKCFPLIPLFNK